MEKGSSKLSRTIKHLFARYHMTMFIVFIIACLTIAVLFLSNILSDASIGEGYESPLTPGTIDQQTLDRINALHTSKDSLPGVSLPSGRVDPFNE